ncbi:FG-GAP repeat domain-containing protein [Streptomyces sp. CWNU-52B]|uniref:FG-GAP repeat domain-containing protein n=1 Tax=unclassified Streptomyces TaxID=2593676 RepID=UPI0039C4B3D0
MHKHLRVTLATATAAALTGGLLTFSAVTASAATTAAKTVGSAAAAVSDEDADFNGDGLADVAVSATGAYVDGKAAAGALTILYGGGAHATITQNTAGVPGTAEKDDYFGTDTAYGDFDGDGYDDVAVGAQGEDVGSDVDGGTVAILWGSAAGLKGGTTVADPRPTKHDWFGSVLEAADFNGDGKDDLALGTYTAATVDVTRGGFTRAGATGGSYTVSAAVQSGDGWGIRFLQSGDANGDGVEDLIVNGYELDTVDGYNANFWYPGSASGVKSASYQKLPAGFITDVGDTDSDGYDDIVFGLSWDDGIDGAQLGGAALIGHGTASGPAYGDVQTIDQDTSGVPGGGESGDGFGSELDLGDVDGDGNLDLVVGTPGEDLAGVADAGSATVLYGAADGSGITGAGAKFLDQNTAGVPNSNEANDVFGSDVHIDDLDGDGRGDVIIGALGENAGNGAVYALRSNPSGTLTSSAGIYTSTVGIPGTGTPVLGANFAD